MNKLKINILALSVILLTAFVSCEKDIAREPSPLPSATASKSFFAKENKSKVELAPTEDSIIIKLVREDATSALTIPIIKVSDKGSDVFKVPGSVTFNADEKESKIKVTVSKLEPFKNYYLELKLDETKTNPYVDSDLGTNNYFVNISQTDWADYAEGIFSSTMFKAEWEQGLQYSKTLNQYRLPDLYEADFHYFFKVDENGGISQVSDKKFPIGYVHPTYGMISGMTDATKSSFDAASQTYTFTITFTVDAGSFGAKTEKFKISKLL